MKRLVLLLLCSAWLLGLPLNAGAADPFIAEFMPDNARTLADEDGQFPDWIELQNPGPGSVNLQGWFLTDDPLVPAKWGFSSVTVPSGGVLVLFASGKNRLQDPTRLHTNFQLDAGGGYLALVKPDGVSVASAHRYPAVKEDVAFGVAQNQIITSLLAGVPARILVPTSAPDLPADWNQLAYAPDSRWTQAAAPAAVGFDTNRAAGLPVNVARTGTAVQSTTSGAFGANLALNGSVADFTHTLGTDNAPFWQVTLTNQMAIYSIVLHNRSSCCGSRLRDITIEILSTNASGTVTNYTSELLNPENAGFAYQNGPPTITNNLVALTGGPVAGRIVRVRRTPDPDLSGSAGQGNADEAAVLSLGEVVVNATAAAGLRPYFTTDLQSQMWNLNASAFVRLPFVTSEPPDMLNLLVRYDDGFVAWLNGVEVARRNAPGSLAWDSAATADRDLATASVRETVDLAAAIPEMRSGANVLAVQWLNANAANGDGLFQAELISTRHEIVTNVFLGDATPGAANAVDWYYDEVADTSFSVDRGFFEAPFSLSITSSTPGAVIYYSFNSDEPGPGKGSLYTGPILITNTTVVRARAFKENWQATDVDTATYLFLGDVIYQASTWPQTRQPPRYFPASWGVNTVDYGMDPQIVTNATLAQWKEAFTQIPTMSIVAEMRSLFDPATGIYANALQHGIDWERPASIELLDPASAVPGRFQENCGLRIRGGYSRNPQYVKHSFRIFFRREYGAGKLAYPLFEQDGAQEFDTFDLRTSQNYSWPRETTEGVHDTMVREVWCRETLGAMGQPYRRSRYYHLYLNGQYWGLYETDERPEASYGESYFGGSKTNFDVVKCGNHVGGFVTEVTDGNFAAWSNLWTVCQAMRSNPSASNYFRVQGRQPDGTRNPSLPVLLDVENLIDYMLEIFYSGDGDATLSSFLGNNQPNNWWAMRDRTNPEVGFRFFNSDCEHTLGAPNSQADRTGPFGGSNESNFNYSNPQWFHEELMRNAEYKVRFGDRVQKHFFNGGALTLEQCTNRWWRKANQITKAVRAYSARWGDAVREPPYGEADWTNRIRFIATNWFPPRAGIVLGQLRADGLFQPTGAPQFSQFGGNVPAGYNLELAHTNAVGVLYVTTDGSDPRSVGGAVSAAAQAYEGPLVINTPVTVRARVRTGTNWSPVVEYSFYPPQNLGGLLITEIMYHPPPLGVIAGDEPEFLELKNAGATVLNLSGLSFTSGITFTFTNGTLLAPGQFFVLTRDLALFAARYPGIMAHGVYSGRLDNAGESLSLSHPLGGQVVSVRYGDRAPWPVGADGSGFSLVPMEPNTNLDPDRASSWRASSSAGGSPGADDPPSPIPPVRINEVLSHSETGLDFIELFNPTQNAVDIGGWFLTDDPATPRKFRVPPGVTLQPLGYVLFDESDFNPLPAGSGGFSLNARGDEAYLFSADAHDDLTGYSHGFSFGAAADGDSFGRYVISTGEEQLPLQRLPTPGQPNLAPRVGPIVINEVMYHPAAGEVEFIELKNITDDVVPLFDEAHPTNTWKLAGADYTFPPNISLGAGDSLLLVLENPAVFQAKYSVPSRITILGPFAGILQDSGERLELQRPDVPDTNGVPYVTVDEVRYNDKAPWPAGADGSGPSLQRKTAAAYGNDPANWEAAVPTPGADYPGGAAPALVTQPSSQVALVGDTVTFSVVAAGAPPLRFQWHRNGEPLTGATGTTLILTDVQLSQAGTYSVFVFNDSGSTPSAPASLTVQQLPRIVAQPASQFVRPGSNAVFTVNVAGNGILRYQWRFNGEDLPGATSALLVLTNATPAREGLYTVIVTDTVGSATSEPAALVLLVDPVIMQGPISQSLIASGAVTLSVTVTNTATLPIGYRLRRNGLLLQTTVPGAFQVLSQRTAFFTLTGTNTMLPWTSYSFDVTNRAKPGGNTTASAVLTYLADLDNDRIPDDWEQAHFGSNAGADANTDSDGDGMRDAQEYLAGTDPNDPLNYLKVDSLTATDRAVLTFPAISNRTYTVHFTDALRAAAWTKLVDVQALPTNRIEVIIDPAYTSRRFYRLGTPRQ